MSLSDSQLERFARQVIIPGVGVAGQERLLGSRVLLVGNPDEREIAGDYLTRSGVSVVTRASERIDCVVACGIDSLNDSERAVLRNLREDGLPVVWYRIKGNRLTAGIASLALGTLPPTSHFTRASDPRPSSAEALAARAELCALAACDAAGTALCVLLQWPQKTESRETDLV